MENNFILEQVMEKGKNVVDKIEAFYYNSHNYPVDFESNKLKTINTKFSTGLGVRVIHKGKLGFASTSDLTKIDQVINNALESSQYGMTVSFDFPEQIEYNSVKNYDEAVNNLSVDDQVNFGNGCLEQVLEKHSDVNCNMQINKIIRNSYIINSNGLDVSWKKTFFLYYLSAFLMEKDEGFQKIWQFDGSCHLIHERKELIQKLNRLIAYARKVLPFKTADIPVIFMPSALEDLIMIIGQGLNGKSVQKGTSPILNKINLPILDKKISIYDDPTIDYALGTCFCDCEGIPTQRKVLIENGILKSYIFDLQSASLMNKKSTGNGFRSGSGRPFPSASNIVIDQGDISLKDLLNRHEKTLIVYQCLGGGQSNVMAGDFSLNIGLGYLAEKGEIQGRIKNAMIAGNVYEDLLNNVECLTIEREVQESMILPAICFKSMKVVAKN